MGSFLPAISLAIVHIAGDNAGVVPDAAAASGADVYLVTVLAYMVLGTIITAVCAWIGACSGFELGVLTRRIFGCSGKKMLAVAILVISIPASALTGGYFSGWLVHNLTGLPYAVAAFGCLALFSLLAAGYFDDVLTLASYGSLLFVPIVILLFLGGGRPPAIPSFANTSIDWALVLALLAYNAGGMRPILVTEAAACLAKRGRPAVVVSIAAKMVEGLVTLAMAGLVIAAGTEGPLAISVAATNYLGPVGGLLFDCSLLCVFLTAMAPAMMVNARQTASLTGLGFWPSLITAALAVYLVNCIEYFTLLSIMGGTGFLMMGFIVYTAYVLYKQRRKQ
ncbi:MAG: hypothetical protein P4N59_15025 [Negativicutes bacterium]|nr:hypothetical protein [Negativicutes bacterium]